jgi:hypothetical protein
MRTESGEVDYFFRKNVRDEFPRGDVVEQRPE